MKKLLSWLGAVTLTAVAPLNVIACKKEPTTPPKEEVPEFDYVTLKNEMQNELTEIYLRNLEQDFKGIRILDPENIPEEFDFINFENLGNLADAKDLNDTTSKNYGMLLQDLTNVINFEKLNEEIGERIIKNVNYRPLLKGIGNPIENYMLTNVEVIVQPEAVSLSFSYVANYRFVINDNSDLEYEKMNFDFIINIFDDYNIAEHFKNAEATIMKTMIAHSNDFSFDSDSGDLDINADKIIKDGEIKTELDLIFENIELDNSDFKVISDKTKFSMDKKITQDASIANPKFGYGLEPQKDWVPEERTDWEQKLIGWEATGDFEYDYPKEWLNLMKPMLKSQKGAGDAFAEKLLDKELGLIDHQLPEEIKEKIAANEDVIVSEPINHYNLNANIENSDFGKMLTQNGYKFVIDDKKDYKAIAAYGGNLKGVQVTYIGDREVEEATTIQMGNIFVPIKQFTTQENTQELYRLFLRAAIDLQQKYLLQNTPEKGYYEYEGGKPRFENYQKFDKYWFTKYYIAPAENTVEIIKELLEKNKTISPDMVLPDTIEFKEKTQSEEFQALNTSSDFANGKFEKFSGFNYFDVLANNYKNKSIYLYDHFDYSVFGISTKVDVDKGKSDFQPDFRTYFFSSGVKSNSEKTYFSLGKRGDFLYFMDYGQEWGATNKLRFNFGADETWK